MERDVRGIRQRRAGPCVCNLVSSATYRDSIVGRCRCVIVFPRTPRASCNVHVGVINSVAVMFGEDEPGCASTIRFESAPQDYAGHNMKKVMTQHDTYLRGECLPHFRVRCEIITLWPQPTCGRSLRCHGADTRYSRGQFVASALAHLQEPNKRRGSHCIGPGLKGETCRVLPSVLVAILQAQSSIIAHCIT